MLELLAPAGTLEKLKTAAYFGADAVYFSGTEFGLRSFAGNFTESEILEGIKFLHEREKKAYVTLNIFARDSDFEKLPGYLEFLQDAAVDAVIVSDLGMISFILRHAPKLNVHVSTQANVLNSYELGVFHEMGVKRVVLARELGFLDIEKLKVPPGLELEAFVHGAMCIAYSGRCLLSNYLAHRDSNRGACVQACRWKYNVATIKEAVHGYELELAEDERGAYVFNSKDLCLIEYLERLKKTGVTSFKVEGRMKSEYYVAVVTNAYRRAIDRLGCEFDLSLLEELKKASHRPYTTGFYLDKDQTEHHSSSAPVQLQEFVAKVTENASGGFATVEMRNRFKVGDVLEVLSPGELFNEKFRVKEILDEENNSLEDAKIVQQILKIKTSLALKAGDILRR